MSTYHAPNLNAPRFRPQREHIINREFLSALKKKHPECKHLSVPEVREIINTFNEAIRDIIVFERNGFQLPEGIGYIFVAATESKKKPIDPIKSKELGRVVTYKNWGTDGKVGKIIYTNYKAKYRFQNAFIWGFSACRKFSRAASAEFKQNWHRYKVLDRHVNAVTYKK